MTNATVLTFEIRPSKVEADRKRWPPKPEFGPRIVGHTYFTHPVRFAVNGVEMFGPRDNPLLLVPLIGVGVFMRHHLDESRQRGSAAFEPLPGYVPIYFRHLPNGYVEVTGPSGGQAVATREEIEQAMDRFDASVREFLLAEFPDLREHSAYGWWFRGEPPPEGFFEDG